MKVRREVTGKIRKKTGSYGKNGGGTGSYGKINKFHGNFSFPLRESTGRKFSRSRNCPVLIFRDFVPFPYISRTKSSRFRAILRENTGRDVRDSRPATMPATPDLPDSSPQVNVPIRTPVPPLRPA